MVAITYRTTDLLKWGVGKGANLTPAEVDDNFYELVLALAAIELAEPVGIAAITVDGNQMSVTLTDASVQGPFTLPVATFNFTGNWVPSHQYAANDLFLASSGLYFVNKDHISNTDFNPLDGDIDGPFASLIMPFPTTFSVGFSFPGKPGFGIEVSAYEAQAMWTYRADRAFWLPIDLVGSVGGLLIDATANMEMPIMKNLDQIGTISVTAGDNAVAFTFAAVVQFFPSDTLRVLRPVELDTTAKDLSITFQGQLGEFEPVS